MSSVRSDKSLAHLVEENPARARVFEKRNLDFCCGGAESLEEACEDRDFEVAEVRAELESVDRRDDPGPESDFESLTELVDFIVDHHHDYLREELGPLGELVDKVERVHGDAHPELHEVADAFEKLAREIPVHLSEEEQLVFPAVRALEREGADEATLATAEAALDGLVDDHESTAVQLDRIRNATDDYEVPRDACPSYENMLERLKRLERDLHLHVHRENHMLFERLEERVG